MDNVQQVKTNSQKKLSDFLFIFWAGGAALLSYSLVYALRKPYTAAGFDGLEAFGMDYKVVVTIAQILGYVLSKFIGIKLISELKRENRMKFILISIVLAEASLILFGLLPAPYNTGAMFLNGLSLGCMWGIIFSFIEGRRMTDILASLLGVSMVISSGTAKSAGLFVMDTLNISEFWMPALIGGIALPILALLGYSLNRLPQPTAEDIAMKSKRETLNGKQRWDIFKNFMPFLTLLFIANVVLTILRDIKCIPILFVDVCSGRQRSNYHYPCHFRVDGFCTKQLESIIDITGIDHHQHGSDGSGFIWLRTIAIKRYCLVIHSEPLSLSGFSHFSDHFLRPIHRML